MLYRLLTVPNLGYADSATGETLGSIDGLSGGFVHRGYTYPDLSGVTVRLAVEADDGPTTDKRLMVFYEGDELAEGEEVLGGDVLDTLVADFGWPEDAYLDEDGMPVRTDPES